MSFWSLHPAFLIAISFLIGSASSLFSFPLYFTAAFSIYLIWIRKWAALFTLPLSYFYALLLYPQPEPPTGLCTGYLTISSVQTNQTPFHTNVLYRGTFYLNHERYPCSITFPPNSRPIADSDYKVRGHLIQRSNFDYLFKPKSIEKVPNTFSIAELRYQTKTRFRQFLHSRLSSARAATLLSSLSTGEVTDRLLRFQFGRLGLQHILAISGFHFAILIAFLTFLLRFFSHTFQSLLMLLATSLYFVFVGDSPAIQRAYITVTLFLLAKLFRRPTSAVNLLGASLLIELILNPLVANNLGFQLSFGSCFGILLLYPPLEHKLRKLFPQRSSYSTSHLSPFSSLLYLLASFFRKAISLGLAVNITLLPLILFHFGRFPLLSLLYNLFFPFLITVALFLILFFLLLAIPFPSHPFFPLLNFFTDQLLDLVSYPPLSLDYSLYIQSFPYHFIPIYLFALLLFGQNQFKKLVQSWH